MCPRTFSLWQVQRHCAFLLCLKCIQEDLVLDASNNTLLLMPFFPFMCVAFTLAPFHPFVWHLFTFVLLYPYTLATLMNNPFALLDIHPCSLLFLSLLPLLCVPSCPVLLLNGHFSPTTSEKKAQTRLITACSTKVSPPLRVQGQEGNCN